MQQNTPITLPSVSYLPGASDDFTIAVSPDEIMRRSTRACSDPRFGRFIDAAALGGVLRHPQMPDMTMPVLICGAGPSLRREAAYIKEVAPASVVIALNNAHDELIDMGITPDFAAMMEPRDRTVDYMRPHPDVNYLLGTSLCDATFERFFSAPSKVFVWHPLMWPEHLPRVRTLNRLSKQRFMAMNGGSTVGLRIWDFALLVMGGQSFTFVGFDCSAAPNGAMHSRFKGDVATRTVRFEDNGLSSVVAYNTTAAMFRQAGEFWAQYDARKKAAENGHNQQFSVSFVGRGLLPDWAAMRGLHINSKEIRDEIEKAGFVERQRPNPADAVAAFADDQEKTARRTSIVRDVADHPGGQNRHPSNIDLQLGELEEELRARLR